MKLEVYDLAVRYGSRTALKGLSLGQVRGGEVLGIVGDNGSGKSTFLATISGFLPRTAEAEGRILIDGRSVGGRLSRALARRLGIFLLPQDPPVFNVLDNEENVFLGAEKTKFAGFLTDRRAQQDALESLVDVPFRKFLPISRAKMQEKRATSGSRDSPPRAVLW